MKKILLYILCISAILLNLSYGDGGREKSEIFIFTLSDVLLCIFFFLGAIITFVMGGAHEWHLTLQDIRIKKGQITNKQRHQLLAGFKDRAAIWSGILGSFIAIMVTQVEKISEKLQFTTLMSGFLVLFGPYLMGRLIYIFYLHGAEYRQKKTTASKNYLPFYFMNISMLIFIVCYWSISEFVYLIIGYVTSSSNVMYLYLNLSIKNLIALLTPCFIDQTVITIHFLKQIDKRPVHFALISPELARMLGYSETVDMQEEIAKARDSIEIDQKGTINIEDVDVNLLLQTDKRNLRND